MPPSPSGPRSSNAQSQEPPFNSAACVGGEFDAGFPYVLRQWFFGRRKYSGGSRQRHEPRGSASTQQPGANSGSSPTPTPSPTPTLVPMPTPLQYVYTAD